MQKIEPRKEDSPAPKNFKHQGWSDEDVMYLLFLKIQRFIENL